uniref:NADH-ubiquinone oxidoreductase chain 5 n=1 Tax=Paroligoneurus sp. QL-2014 TaxID=1491722 RepID=A0A0U1WEH1_9HYME|nr:NADH dehydrogenase subunit 5 [Paroligoneurus sp. QL-2014]
MYFLISLNMLLISILMFSQSSILLMKKMNFMIEWSFMKIMSQEIKFIIFIDWISLLFISTVLLISSMVLIYSLEYMMNDLFMNRFVYMILLFILSMIFMIISPNMISILLGWDGLGLSSYCLVNYYQNKKSFNSSMITMMMNRFGDICIIMLISLMLSKNSWNIMFIEKISNLMMVLIMLTSFTKSAQIPFSTWLPLAMAAPTPVSSLVHSSTLVTAGVYLLIRFNSVISTKFMNIIMFISCFTMFMASINALLEFDLKKIIALSTLSQLGLMIFTCSIYLPKLALFHLITHAMFKSLLFLCSGIIIHNYFNNQDIRTLNFLNFNMPLISMILNISSFALSGIPFLSGFYSKDFILEMFIMMNKNMFTFMMMYTSIMLTMLYSTRLMFMLNMKFHNQSTMMKSMNSLMVYSILILMILSILYGSILNWMIFNSLNFIIMSLMNKLFVMFILLVGLMLGLTMNYLNKMIMKMIYLVKLFNMMYFLPMIFKLPQKKILLFNNKLIKNNEMSWIEYISSKYLLNKMNKFMVMNKYTSTLIIMIMTMYLMLMMMLI